MRLLNSANLLPLLALTLSWLPQSTYASVLAIDYGADFIKASLMKPGVPFDVILNKDSKRKIHATVAWSNGDRLFGQDAFNTGSRFPEETFSNLRLLEAAPFDSPVVSYFSTISSAALAETPRKTVALTRPDGTNWSVEELIAMQLAWVKHLAEEVADEKVTDVIITVPPFFSQFERDAIADAIEISGLKTLALINDGTAVGVNYAMTRTFPTEETHIIYDAGASSIRATVISFLTANDKTGAPQTQLTVRGVGYDRLTGGIEFDRRLREILIKAFNDKFKKDLRTNKRGMTRLWKEAGRVKAILSLNTDAIANVESIAWDLDFKSKVTRAQFEEACADLEPSFTRPIEDALRNAGLTLADINSVILTGGATRTPMVRRALNAMVGEDKIATNVNADEAAVLGAALHGASLSRQFKTKNIKVSDITVHDVQASYAATSSSANSRPRVISTVVFPAGSKVGTKKTLTFRRKEDFTIQFDYKQPPAIGFPSNMLEVELGNVTEAIANLTEAGAADPVVKATITLSESGFVSVTEAVAYGEIKDESITGKIKDFFGAGSSSTEDATQSAEHVPPRESESASASSQTESASSSSASPSPSAAPKEPIKNTIPLDINVKFTSIPPMTVAEKKAARSRLRAIDNEEATKFRRAEARNSLEGYLYRLRDLLDPSNTDTPFKKCSQESERKAIEEKLEESFEWLHERGDLAETSQLLDKRISLESLEQPIIHRYQEIEAFPQALNNSQKWNWSTRLFLTEARTNLTAEAAADLPSKWTKEELDSLEKALKEHETWLNEWVEKQKVVKPNEDPVIETREMKARAKVLETHLHRLWKRKVPKVPKKKATTTTTTTTSAEPTATEGADDQEEPPKVETEGDEKQAPFEGHDEL